MKLQHKLAFYNSITKIAIIAISGFFAIILTNHISISHLQKRLIDKRNRLITNLSNAEVNDLVNMEKTFTDYNILKDEYIILRQLPDKVGKETKPFFITEDRKVDDETQKYLIIISYFNYDKKAYRLEIGETLGSLAQLGKTLLYFSLITMGIAVFISLIVDIAFTRFLLKPFYQIIDRKLNNVNDAIYYNHTPIDTSTEDFRFLDESISSLMMKISNQITNQKQFTSNVSHELLTPISLLMSRLENLLGDEPLSDKGMDKVIASLKTLRRLKSIIHSLLLISKIEQHQYPKENIVNLHSIIEDIYVELKDRLVQKNIQILNRMTSEFKFSGNETLLHILLTNIINNAIKYNKENGCINISDRLTETAYYLSISDQGKGMDADEILLAFNRFEKLGTKEQDSHGLGLAIVKSIANYHNIEVKVDSEKHIGTTVTLIFAV